VDLDKDVHVLDEDDEDDYSDDEDEEDDEGLPFIT
jgi:hypothetical protein